MVDSIHTTIYCALCDKIAVTTAAQIPVCADHYAAYAEEAKYYRPMHERTVYQQLLAAQGATLPVDGGWGRLTMDTTTTPEINLTAHSPSAEAVAAYYRLIFEDLVKVVPADAAREAAERLTALWLEGQMLAVVERIKIGRME